MMRSLVHVMWTMELQAFILFSVLKFMFGVYVCMYMHCDTQKQQHRILELCIQKQRGVEEHDMYSELATLLRSIPLFQWLSWEGCYIMGHMIKLKTFARRTMLICEVRLQGTCTD